MHTTAWVVFSSHSNSPNNRLETPKYRVLRSWRAGPGALDGVVELRSYPPFTVARKGMGGAGFGAVETPYPHGTRTHPVPPRYPDPGAGFGAVEGGGAGFNALASYLFGDNAGVARSGTPPHISSHLPVSPHISASLTRHTRPCPTGPHGGCSCCRRTALRWR